jgi:hypothetical protein
MDSPGGSWASWAWPDCSAGSAIGMWWRPVGYKFYEVAETPEALRGASVLLGESGRQARQELELLHDVSPAAPM